MSTKFTTLLAASFLLLSTQLSSQTPAQWRGPERSGHYPDKGLLTSWPASGPELAWSVEGIGKGYSTAVWDGKQYYITGMIGKEDMLTALGEKGEILWQTSFGPSWTESFPETRSTPIIEDGKAYVVSGSGNLACINASDGSIIWSFDAREKFKGAFGDWGVCESLLITGNKLIYTPAGPQTTMVALDKTSGETIWMSESLNDTSAYVSPLLVEYGGKKLIISVINSYFLGVNEADGKIIWTYNYGALKPEKGLEIWPGAPKTNTITPLYHNGEIYITGGYNHVGAKFKMTPDASSIELMWIDSSLDCHMGGVVLQDGKIYGSNWINNTTGNWCCIDWASGETLYETKWNTKGAIIEADGLLYCVEEKNSNVALVKPDPGKFSIISSFKAPKGTGPAWSHPSIYNGLLLVRRGDALMAFKLRP